MEGENSGVPGIEVLEDMGAEEVDVDVTETGTVVVESTTLVVIEDLVRVGVAAERTNMIERTSIARKVTEAISTLSIVDVL